MKIETLFTLSKDGVSLDVNDWTKALGLSPIECCQCGQKIPFENSKSISTSSYWTNGILKTEDDSINSQVLKVLDIIYPKKNEINTLIEEYRLDCGVASFVWVGDDFSSSDIDFYLETKTIKKLSEIQSDFNICIYEQ